MARSQPAALGWSIFIGRLSPRIFFERVLQHAWLMVLSQEVGEGFIGRLLHVLAAVAGEHIKRFPSCTTFKTQDVAPRLSYPVDETLAMVRQIDPGRELQL